MNIPRGHRLKFIAGIGAAVTITLLLWFVPRWQVASWERVQLDGQKLTIKELAELEDKFRGTLATIIAGGGLLLGLYFTWRSLVVSQEGQLTERFGKAVEHLGASNESGKPRLELRLGGIIALERIARDSEKDHWSIMEILSAYVRENAAVKNIENSVTGPATLRQDIAVILTVFRRRVHMREGKEHQLWLNRVDLRYANLTGTRLVGANLVRSNLEEAILDDADLEGAFLIQATLKNTSLESANLRKADLQFADVTGASFEGAILRGANLEHVVGLTFGQLREAVCDGSTKLPEYLVGS